MNKSTIVIGLDAAEPRLIEEESIDGHSAIALDLLKQDNWDLFLMVFGETHVVI